ncbi:MOSC domain-containing protein [Rhizobium oryzicola]|uniref:MOSC domain-containing protein n=1 Tax=Rhizobium oryzicola TaxID=1232668 RepID=A0ABT8STB6_9HYPH|nr:MOSC domain-containing protein [Rhizobium oryzicola]MDO1581636.1 MOSC domain-containing protein [Rhizobium oryzicola]
MRVSALKIYPLKSGRGIPLHEAEIGREGLAGDRRWMITDPSGRFITQRELPQLATLVAEPQAASLRLSMGSEVLDVAHPAPERRLEVVVWKSTVSAAVCDDATNAIVSKWLGQDVRLVFFDPQASRTASSEWAGPDSPVTFADGYQILVTTTGSLAALNADMQKHGEVPVTMDRFRPNIVLDHDEPWAEDGWTAIEIDGLVLSFVKPCSRCIMTTQDQLTGSREGANPMPAMGRIRMSADRRVPGPLFGWNAVPLGTGRIVIGADVKVLEQREPWPFKQR